MPPQGAHTAAPGCWAQVSVEPHPDHGKHGLRGDERGSGKTGGEMRAFALCRQREINHAGQCLCLWCRNEDASISHVFQAYV